MNFNLKARLVAAVAQFKAKHDIRFYLNGVLVEPVTGTRVVLPVAAANSEGGAA